MVTLSNGHRGEVVQLQIPGDYSHWANGKIVRVEKINPTGLITVYEPFQRLRFLVRMFCIARVLHCPHIIRPTPEERALITKRIRYMHLTAGDGDKEYGSQKNAPRTKGATLKRLKNHKKGCALQKNDKENCTCSQQPVIKRQRKQKNIQKVK